MASFTFTVTQQDLIPLVKPLAGALQKGDVIALWGDLGVGKTTFAKILIQALVGKNINVLSPTFTLVQVYDCPQGEIWHGDLYRLNAPEEIFEIGLEDAFHTSLCLIEWPERLGHFLPQRRIDVLLKIVNETTREMTITLVGSHDCVHAALTSL